MLKSHQRRNCFLDEVVTPIKNNLVQFNLSIFFIFKRHKDYQ